MPARILDLSCEYKAMVNGTRGKGEGPASLVSVLSRFGLDTIGAQDKRTMVDRILAGGPWDEAERTAILDYCESDVVGLERLLPRMLPRIDLPRSC